MHLGPRSRPHRMQCGFAQAVELLRGLRYRSDGQRQGAQPKRPRRVDGDHLDNLRRRTDPRGLGIEHEHVAAVEQRGEVAGVQSQRAAATQPVQACQPRRHGGRDRERFGASSRHHCPYSSALGAEGLLATLAPCPWSDVARGCRPGATTMARPCGGGPRTIARVEGLSTAPRRPCHGVHAVALSRQCRGAPRSRPAPLAAARRWAETHRACAPTALRRGRRAPR